MQAGLLQFSSDSAADVHFKRLQSVQNAAARLVSGARRHDHITSVLIKTPLASRELCSRLWCWCGSVLTALLPATSPNSAFLLPLFQVVSISGQPRQAYTTISQGSYHGWPVELRCCGTISVEHSSCCSTETRDDSAHFQETTESLSVPHLMCWRTEGTFTTARHCCVTFS